MEEAPKFPPVSRKRTLRPLSSPPRLFEARLDEDGVRPPPQSVARPLGEDRAAAERDDGRLVAPESLRHDSLFEPTKLGLAALVEEPRDRAVARPDLLVGIHERSLCEAGDLAADRGLPRPHEADEGEVLAERPYLGDQSIRSR